MHDHDLYVELSVFAITGMGVSDACKDGHINAKRSELVALIKLASRAYRIHFIDTRDCAWECAGAHELVLFTIALLLTNRGGDNETTTFLSCQRGNGNVPSHVAVHKYVMFLESSHIVSLCVADPVSNTEPWS